MLHCCYARICVFWTTHCVIIGFCRNISYNNFNGTFSTGPYFNPLVLDVSNNNLTNITFEKFYETTSNNGSVYMPFLQELYASNLVGPQTIVKLKISKIYIFNNTIGVECFITFYFKLGFMKSYLTDHCGLSSRFMQSNSLRGAFPVEILTSPTLKTLWAPYQENYENSYF